MKAVIIGDVDGLSGDWASVDGESHYRRRDSIILLPLDDATVERLARALERAWERQELDQQPHERGWRWRGLARAAIKELVEGER